MNRSDAAVFVCK